MAIIRLFYFQLLIHVSCMCLSKEAFIIKWPETINIDSDIGMTLTDFTVITSEIDLLSNHRGVWGGQQSRMVATDEGVFATFIYKYPDDEWGTNDGYEWKDRRRVLLVMRPAACPGGKWVVLDKWAHNSNTPIIVADARGNVYVVQYENLNDETRHQWEYRPSVSKYIAGSWDTATGTLTTPMVYHRWLDMPGLEPGVHGQITGAYTSANISPDGIIYILTADNVSAERTNIPDNLTGFMDIVAFDTNTQKWSAAARLWTELRFCYMYLNFAPNANGVGYDIEIIGNRDDFWSRTGYINLPNFGWIFDGFTYWRISPEFPTTAGPTSSIPPKGYTGWKSPNFANIVKETVLIKETPSDYDSLDWWPNMIFSACGDVFWDNNGDIHMFYQRSDIASGQTPDQWHMLLRDGEIVFNKPLFPAPCTLTMLKDSGGNYYLLVSSNRSSAADMYKAAVTNDTGWEFEKIGSFELPVPMRQYGFSQAYIQGLAGHGDTVYVMYPIRGPQQRPEQDTADEWAYFRLNLILESSSI